MLCGLPLVIRPSLVVLFRLVMHTESGPYSAWLHKPTGAFYIADEARSKMVGPLLEHHVLRRLRQANERVLHGRDLGPRTFGFHRMASASSDLPEHEWEIMQPSWLAPSVTAYVWQDRSGEDVPRAVWVNANPLVSWAQTDLASSLLPEKELLSSCRVAGFEPGLEPLHFGMSSKSWNLHPPGCQVVTRSTATGETFLVIDLPPLPGAQLEELAG